jgi:hypothetical protein
MAKSFGDAKQPKYWLRLPSTKNFLNELSKVRNSHLEESAKGRNLPLADLVQIKRGGTNPGTWFHEDVALEFARWLSPAFAIWCNDRIKEILLSQANGGIVPVFRQTPPAIDTTEKDREIAKWKSCFTEAMLVIKSMGESNTLERQCFRTLLSMMEGGVL